MPCPFMIHPQYYVFVSMGRGLGQTMADIGNAIKNGAGAVWGGIKTGAGAAWEGVKDFSESTVNLFTEGSFAMDETLIQREERIRQINRIFSISQT